MFQIWQSHHGKLLCGGLNLKVRILKIGPLEIKLNVKNKKTIVKDVIEKKRKNFALIQNEEVLDKKEWQQSRFYRNRAQSNCSFASLKWFRKVHVHHAFLINDDKILSSLLNL